MVSSVFTCMQLIIFSYIIGLAKVPVIWGKRLWEVETIFPSEIIWEMFVAFSNFMCFNIGLSYGAWIILRYDLSPQSFQSLYYKDVINFTDWAFWILRQLHDFCLYSVGMIHCTYWFAYVQSFWDPLDKLHMIRLNRLIFSLCFCISLIMFW